MRNITDAAYASGSVTLDSLFQGVQPALDSSVPLPLFLCLMALTCAASVASVYLVEWIDERRSRRSALALHEIASSAPAWSEAQPPMVWRETVRVPPCRPGTPSLPWKVRDLAAPEAS